MAYMVEYVPRVCSKCGAPAKVIIRNNYNAEIGHFCKPCGKRMLARLNEGEGS